MTIATNIYNYFLSPCFRLLISVKYFEIFPTPSIKNPCQWVVTCQSWHFLYMYIEQQLTRFWVSWVVEGGTNCTVCAVEHFLSVLIGERGVECVYTNSTGQSSEWYIHCKKFNQDYNILLFQLASNPHITYNNYMKASIMKAYQVSVPSAITNEYCAVWTLLFDPYKMNIKQTREFVW